MSKWASDWVSRRVNDWRSEWVWEICVREKVCVMWAAGHTTVSEKALDKSGRYQTTCINIKHLEARLRQLTTSDQSDSHWCIAIARYSNICTLSALKHTHITHTYITHTHTRTYAHAHFLEQVYSARLTASICVIQYIRTRLHKIRTYDIDSLPTVLRAVFPLESKKKICINILT